MNCPTAPYWVITITGAGTVTKTVESIFLTFTEVNGYVPGTVAVVLNEKEILLEDTVGL